MRHLLFLLMMGLLLFSCNGQQKEAELSPAQLLLDLNSSERIVSPEQVADLIVNQDPSLRLIDVRNHDEFDKFTLPGAINVPLNELLNAESQLLMDCSRYTVVFFSNDDLLATQAWTLKWFDDCSGALVMKGGLNEWTATIMSPPQPAETDPEEVWELYRFRKAISQYLIGGSEELRPEKFVGVKKPPTTTAPKKVITPVPKKKVVVEEEGC